MSYILDALRRAEAERERGGVPGLHAQTITGVPSAGEPRAPMPPWVWLVAGGAIAGAGALAWALFAREPAPAPAVTAAAPPASPAVAGVQAPLPVPSPVPSPSPAPPPAPAQPERQVVPTPAPMPAVSASAIATAPPAVASPEPVVQTLPAPRPAASQAAPPVRVYAVAELPEDVRRQLPAIAVGGSIHSPDPASRVLIINGQLFHEKDKVTPELTLLQIHLKEAVLLFREHRFKISF